MCVDVHFNHQGSISNTSLQVKAYIVQLECIASTFRYSTCTRADLGTTTLIMTLLSTIKTSNIHERCSTSALNLSSKHWLICQVSSCVTSVQLSSFFVHEAHNDIIKCELVRWSGVEGNNERFIGWQEAKGEGQDDIFIRDIHTNLLQLECDAVHFGNPSLDRLLIRLAKHEKFAAQHEVHSKTTGIMDGFKSQLISHQFQ